MAKIPTVRGVVDSADLGVTLMHEHICFGPVFPGAAKFPKKAMEYQVKLMREAVAVGVNTMVDCTPYPLMEKVIEANREVPEMNLITSTGAYLCNASCPEEIRNLTEQEMVDHMTKCLTEGYGDSGVRAGIIKIASSKPVLTEWEKKNFRAAARVQSDLSVPIVAHSCAGARTQMEYLREHGANIAATFYSHVAAEFGWEGRSVEEEAQYLEDVTRAGGYLQFNNFEWEFDTPFEDLLLLINYIEEHGFGDKIFIAIDANFQFDDDGKIWHEAEKEHPETGKRTYAYAITGAVPMLMSGGVSLQRIWKYLVENPRRYFEAFETGSL